MLGRSKTFTVRSLLLTNNRSWPAHVSAILAMKFSTQATEICPVPGTVCRVALARHHRGHQSAAGVNLISHKTRLRRPQQQTKCLGCKTQIPQGCHALRCRQEEWQCTEICGLRGCRVSQHPRTSVVPAEMKRVDDAAANGSPVQALLCLHIHHVQLCNQHNPLMSTPSGLCATTYHALSQGSPNLP